MNLIIILLVLFAGLFVVIKVLDGKAKPLEAKQESRLGRWAIGGICVLLLLTFFELL